MPIAERIIIPVQGGSQVPAASSQDSRSLRMRTISSCWESEEAQNKFQASADFTSPMSHMEPHLRAGQKPIAYFVKFTPHAPKEILDAALVQVVTVTSSESEDKIRAAFEKFAPVEGFTSVASRYSTSDVGGKGKVFVGIMGWSTLEASAKGSHA